MQRPIRTANALRAIAANRALDQRDNEKADLLEVVRATALQVAALTELVVELDNRLTAMEGAH